MKSAVMFALAVNAQLSGQAEEAKTLYKKLLRKHPDNSEVIGNLAVLIKKDGQVLVAEQMLKRALVANPKNYSALTTLANIQIARKNFDEAEKYNKAALKIEPFFPEAILNEGVILISKNKLDEGEASLWRVLTVDPHHVNARINIANLARLRKLNVDGSIEVLNGILKEQPDNAGIHLLLCFSYQDTQRFVKAFESAKRAIDIDPNAEYLMAAGNSLVVLGEFEEAIQYYKEADRLMPDNPMIGATYLFALNYDNRKNQQEVYDEYKSFGELIARNKEKFDHAGREKIQGRRIRIGYVSADFYSHVVSYFIEPILRNHDHTKFEVIAYANVIKPDDHTLHLKRYFDKWVDIVQMTDDEAAEAIRKDDVDILIDLSGHTAGNRLSAMAKRPAPIQATYLGFGYTTGMTEIDYFIGDDNFVPQGSESYFAEQVLRIPAPVYAYHPPRAQISDVKPLPALAKGYVTFGTMTRMVRLNTDMLKVWKQILDRVPNSKLRFDQKTFEDPETIERFTGRLEALGFKREQIELVSTRPHWDGYHDFDIALDCWPHNAGTTTFEALFLGVPVISKRDRVSVGRLSDMVLTPLGLGDWVADTEAEFVEKAVAMASDIPALAEIRAGLRGRVETSSFLDFKARTRGLESGYIEMVRRYNEERK